MTPAKSNPAASAGPASEVEEATLRARRDALRDLLDETERALAAYGEAAPRRASAAGADDAGEVVPLKVAAAAIGWTAERLKDHLRRHAERHPDRPPLGWQAGGPACRWLVHLGRLRAYVTGS